jgi:hypothetical protein
MKKREENRLTIIDEDGGRVYERFNVELEEDIQDEGRTLKIFVKPNTITQRKVKKPATSSTTQISSIVGISLTPLCPKCKKDYLIVTEKYVKIGDKWKLLEKSHCKCKYIKVKEVKK